MLVLYSIYSIIIFARVEVYYLRYIAVIYTTQSFCEICSKSLLLNRYEHPLIGKTKNGSGRAYFLL